MNTDRLTSFLDTLKPNGIQPNEYPSVAKIIAGVFELNGFEGTAGDKRWLTTNEAATTWGVSDSWLKDAAGRGVIERKTVNGAAKGYRGNPVLFALPPGKMVETRWNGGRKDVAVVNSR